MFKVGQVVRLNDHATSAFAGDEIGKLGTIDSLDGYGECTVNMHDGYQPWYLDTHMIDPVTDEEAMMYRLSN